MLQNASGTQNGEHFAENLFSIELSPTGKGLYYYQCHWEALPEPADWEERHTYPFHQAKTMRPSMPVESGGEKEVS